MNPVLYLIMRNDLVSLTHGKSIAQGSHAANAFVEHINAMEQQLNSDLVWFQEQSPERAKKILQFNILSKAYNTWKNSTNQGFGTVLVLEGNMQCIENITDQCAKSGYIASVVHDPTYPIVDGSVVHHMPLDTCSYVFVPDKDTDTIAVQVLAEFPLHR